MDQLAIVIVVATMFYALIPGVGAVAARTRWRRFRERVIEASRMPIVSYRQVNASSTFPEHSRIGHYRCFGALEAIEDDNIVWVRDGRSSFACNMRNETLFLLATEGGGEQEAPFSNRLGLTAEPPTAVRWEALSSLPEGTGMFIAGPLYAEGGKALFQSTPDDKLLVVLYDGEPETVLRRCIESGRQRNEYWNQLTPISLAAGALALLLTAYLLVQQPLLRLPAIIAAGLGVAPLLPMLPPGVPLFFLYRRLWRRGRELRAERDVLRLPLRFFQLGGEEASVDAATLPDGERYCGQAVSGEVADALLEAGAAYEQLPFAVASGRSSVELYAFGRPREQAEGVQAPLEPPADPMVDLVVVAGGHPARLAQQCQRRAQRLELTAVATLGAAMIMNLYLALLVISRIIR